MSIIGAQALNSVVKLQHLINACQGEAAKRLKVLRIVGANFKVAWEKLTRHYDNRRVRLFTHLEILINAKPVLNRSVAEFNRIMDTAEEIRQGLSDLGCPID